MLLWNPNVFECKKYTRTMKHSLNSEIDSLVVDYIDKEFDQYSFMDAKTEF